MAASNEALADAISGVVGTLVSLWCFYPIERIKTNLQAGKRLSSLTGSSSTTGTQTATTPQNDSDRIQRQLKFLLDLIRQSFRGCLTKSMHATSSSFCYFYFYSWILSYYNHKRKRRLQSGSSHSGHSASKLPPLRPSTRLVLSAIAAMMNTFVTLPLDVLSSKCTVESENDDKKEEMDTRTSPKIPNGENCRKATMEKTWNSIDKKGAKSLPGLAPSTTCSSSESSSSSTVEVVFHEACSRSEELFDLHDDNEDHENDNNVSIVSSNSTSSSNSIFSYNEEYKMRWKERQEQLKARRLRRKRQLEETTIRDDERPTIGAMNMTNIATNSRGASTQEVVACIRRWSKLWKGLAPALLLCSNPSIHYTTFDMLKTKMLAWKRLRNRPGVHQGQLSVSEAFVLGLLSKFVATIVTYPLIRAKVLMMVRCDDPTPKTKTSSQDGDISLTVTSPTLWSVLKESYHRDGGIPGLYKGCDWQLIHTLLKSALMMAIREKITDKSRALFGVSSK